MPAVYLTWGRCQQLGWCWREARPPRRPLCWWDVAGKAPLEPQIFHLQHLFCAHLAAKTQLSMLDWSISHFCFWSITHQVELSVMFLHNYKFQNITCGSPCALPCMTPPKKSSRWTVSAPVLCYNPQNTVSPSSSEPSQSLLFGWRHSPSAATAGHVGGKSPTHNTHVTHPLWLFGQIL